MGDLTSTERIMSGAVLVAVSPGLTGEMLEYVVGDIATACTR